MTTDIFVAKPFLPPLEEFIPYLQQIWDNGILTNGGPYHVELERQLAETRAQMRAYLKELGYGG